MVKVQRFCIQCGKEFHTYQHYIERYNGKGGRYCSKACFGVTHSRKITRQCLVCGKEFKIKLSHLRIRGGGRYCSKNCMFKAKTRKLKFNCERCGEEFFQFKSLARRGIGVRFCSPECWYSTIVGKGNPNYKHGKRLAPHNFSNWKKIRKMVLFRDRFSCRVCGSHSNLVVHHIVPCRVEVSNKLDDLITVCRGCHRTVEGNRLYESPIGQSTVTISVK